MITGAYILVVVVSYFLGSVPAGFLAGKARGIDVRTVGSGNIGATNAFRVLGRTAGTMVLAFDAFKGFAAVHWTPVLAVAWFPEAGAQQDYLALVAGVAVILGHNFTCWLNFKGGKGIATSAGVVLAWAPLACVAALALWGIVFVATKFVSLASIAAALILPVAVWYSKRSLAMTLVMAALSALAILKHKPNIQRLLAGTENRAGTKKTEFARTMKVTVIGAGAWGTALANLLCQNENSVTLWGHDSAHLREMKKAGCNQAFLPDIPLARSLKFQPDLAKAVIGAECVVLAVPSKFFREVTGGLGDFSGIAVSVTKGIEYETGMTMSGILHETMPKASAAAMSGPTLAMEVARGIPAAIVAAHDRPDTASRIQRLFHRPTFRVYTSNDVLGVELGGALKNVVAIAAGIGDGVGFGDNAKAGLITRAIAEMRRLGESCGALAETFSGLSGLGDLAVTCFSRLSRNRAFGERLGRGEKIEDILASTITVAEGYPTARSAHKLAGKIAIQTPIIDEVYAALYEKKDVRASIHDLMTREMKQED